MANSPQKTLAQLEKTAAAWKTNAAADSFFGLTQAQYDAKVQRSRDKREQIEELKRQLKTLENERNDVDKENLQLERNIANAISGDPKHGEDSSLYEATGRKRKSERQRSGGRPKNKPTE